MSVIERAEQRLNEEERQHELGADNRYDLHYWAAYLDGARAQQKEDKKHCADCTYANSTWPEEPGSAKQDAAQSWVRVEDGLPQMLYQAEGDDFLVDYSLLVLAYREASHDFCLARQMDDGHGATWGTECFDKLSGVTHWIPLPEPKKEDT